MKQWESCNREKRKIWCKSAWRQKEVQQNFAAEQEVIHERKEFTEWSKHSDQRYRLYINILMLAYDHFKVFKKNNYMIFL